ncbi:MAG: peptidoglycan DD-metalloendopeptidase family protein [Candidatus Peribacteraceae bacterium]|nr:peptidoglycan DD-metalloendopeptidase family protein [Candidatus Peribacteraceae bacterium]
MSRPQRSRRERFATYACLLAIFLLCEVGFEQRQVQFQVKVQAQILHATLERQSLYPQAAAAMWRKERWLALQRALLTKKSSPLAGRVIATAQEASPIHAAAPKQIQKETVGEIASASSASSQEQVPLKIIISSPPETPVSSPSSFSSSSSSSSTSTFPAFGHAAYPVSRVPNWGAMHSAAEWDRSYGEMAREDFVSVPRYDLAVLTTSLQELMANRDANIPAVTAKLFYSTRYYGAYNLDATEYSGQHPGVDLKLARGTPVGAIGGGRVQTVTRDSNMGLYVMIEHRLPEGTFFSIYGHLDEAWVKGGEDIAAGKAIGIVGMTGATTAPHLHLQVDRDDGVRPHIRYWPASSGAVDRTVAQRSTVNPLTFIGQYQ